MKHLNQYLISFEFCIIYILQIILLGVCVIRDKDWKGMLSESGNCLKGC